MSHSLVSKLKIDAGTYVAPSLNHAGCVITISGVFLEIGAGIRLGSPIQ
jgi:hypothetical protein